MATDKERQDMLLRGFRVAILAFALTLPFPLSALGQSGSNADPLKPYTKCKGPGDLEIREVTRRASGASNHREVTTASGNEKVSVTDGYRVMFAYPDLLYYFANVKIEQSAPDRYPKDKEILIKQLRYYSSTKQATAMIFADKALLNGFEHYGMDRDKIDVGGQVGTHVLFYDPAYLVITIYFLNQSKAIPLNKRRFETIGEYREWRDSFLNSYSECLKLIASAQH
jgi:hypothetical protein